MRRSLLLLSGIILTNILSGQVVKLQTGTAISKLDWKINGINTEEYNDYSINYSCLIGFDYPVHKSIDISCNTGYICKGGQSDVQYLTATGTKTKTEKVKLNYLTLNTGIDIKFPVAKYVIPYISVGQRLDYLTGSSGNTDQLLEFDELKDFVFGFLIGGGVKFDLGRILFGFRADYYLNTGNIAEYNTDYYGTGLGKSVIKNNLILVNFTIGYKLN